VAREGCARENGGVIGTEDWSEGDSEAMAQWGVRRRQWLNRVQPPSKRNPHHSGGLFFFDDPYYIL
jgi:hypothetical protein